MINVLVWLFVTILSLPAEAQGILIDKESRISFFSEAPLENISAETKKAASALDMDKYEIAFKVPIKSFVFKKRLMQEHFNENYMESDKFPYATFSGKINEPLDWQRNGAYQVTVSGNLEIHGVKKLYTTTATIEVSETMVGTTAKFRVRVVDHNIKIPRVVIKNIAEVVEVDVSATYRKQ
ncbi:YceI family protein [Parapedobacter deserti]|uniref:YceI family protein n=1 Tax=Parapedobacter deserti TaxID=1912957 RepID=A0ABV7JP89_9SPHI